MFFISGTPSKSSYRAVLPTLCHGKGILGKLAIARFGSGLRRGQTATTLIFRGAVDEGGLSLNPAMERPRRTRKTRKTLRRSYLDAIMRASRIHPLGDRSEVS
jgi:hypothetical protein